MDCNSYNFALDANRVAGVARTKSRAGYACCQIMIPDGYNYLSKELTAQAARMTGPIACCSLVRFSRL